MYTPERWCQIKDILGRALERAPEERAAFLDRACRADAFLHREVQSLLAYDDSNDGILERPIFSLRLGLLS